MLLLLALADLEDLTQQQLAEIIQFSVPKLLLGEVAVVVVLVEQDVLADQAVLDQQAVASVPVRLVREIMAALQTVGPVVVAVVEPEHLEEAQHLMPEQMVELEQLPP